MILSSKQCLLVSSQESREFFLFDPKTTAVLQKYRDETFLSGLAYYPASQQLLAQQINKSFLSVWSHDAQEPDLRVSLAESLSTLAVWSSWHYLVGGSASGSLYFWELPGGILLRKKVVHSGEVRRVLEYRNNHLLTASRTEVKLWPLSALFLEADHAPALKTYSSVLEIVEVAETRNILAVLTHKSVSFLQLSLEGSKELPLILKIDFEYVSALCVSRTAAFVGEGKGSIEVVELLGEEERTQVGFRVKEGTREVEVFRPRRKRVLVGSKHPVSSLAFVESLAYLVAGHASGEVVIWSNYEIKKSLHLFKSAVHHLLVLPKPHQLKVHQANKLRPLNKYELANKEQEPLDILPDFTSAPAPAAQACDEEQEEERVLQNMLGVVNEPEKLLREEVERLKSERRRLVESNLHYFRLLSE